MPLEERLLDAVLDLTKEVHTMGTKIDEKIAVLIEANKLKEKEQDDRIADVETITKTVAPLAKIIRNKEYVLVGIFVATMLTGFSLGQLVIARVNDMTGVTELSKVVKKNSETLNRLITYLHLEKEVQE